MAFETITVADGEKFKFDKPGVAIEGFYLGTEELEIDGKIVLKHSVEAKDGIKAFLGSMDLDKGMAKLSPGALTRITYTDLKKLKGGKTLKVFKFEVDNAAGRSAAKTAQPSRTIA